MRIHILWTDLLSSAILERATTMVVRTDRFSKNRALHPGAISTGCRLRVDMLPYHCTGFNQKSLLNFLIKCKICTYYVRMEQSAFSATSGMVMIVLLRVNICFFFFLVVQNKAIIPLDRTADRGMPVGSPASVEKPRTVPLLSWCLVAHLLLPQNCHHQQSSLH